MPSIRSRRARHASPLPLFVWADAQKHIGLTYPARVVARRYRVPPGRAALIADLAGLNGEGRV